MPIDDFEGNLIQPHDGITHYVKELSLETAFHTDLPENIQYLQEEFIQSADLHFDENRLDIHYKPGVQPLNLERLRSLLAANTPFYHWRFIKLAIDLCEHLKELHSADLPQQVIHPGRVAAMDKRFILLPTLARVMPPFDRLNNQDDVAWLHFIAPEILRTRGNDPGLFTSGDIYSLGRTLQALIMFDWQPPRLQDPFSFIKAVIETYNHEFPVEWSPDFLSFKPIIEKICAFFPEDRPTLDEVLEMFNEVLKEYNPGCIIHRLLTEKQLDQASSNLGILRESQSSPLFAIPPQSLYKLEAQFLLAQSPPDYGQAIGFYQKVLHHEPNNIGIHLEIAQTYFNYRLHPQHLFLCTEAYEKAGELAEWREDIVNRLMEVLSMLGNPAKTIQVTNRIPPHKRPGPVYLLRAQSFMAIGYHMSCWRETFGFFKIYGFDETMYNLAQKTASFIAPLDLLRWYYQVKNEENIPAGANISFSIVWQRNQNIEKAQQYLEKGSGKKINQGG